MSESDSDPRTVTRPTNESVIAKLFVFAILLAVVPLALLYAVLNGAADGTQQAGRCQPISMTQDSQLG